jgi:prepilin-type processing-associated H-X9-DG protein
MNRRLPITACLLLMILGLGSVTHAQEAEPLARYVPLDGLSILVENNGLASKPKAWKATATYKMLNETTLGAMLEDITAQLVDRAFQGGAPAAPFTGKEAVGLLEHLIGEGFAIGYCGSLNPPQPRAVVIVIRNAAKNPVFKKTIAAIPPLNAPAARKLDAPGGRTVWQIEGPPVRWWYEKDDAVFSFAPPGAPDPVIAVLEGKAASALKSPVRDAVLKGDAGEVPIGAIFVDMKAMPPLPPRAAEFGLDAITRIEARLAILDKGLVTAIGVQAPRPRKGILAFFDQPAIGNSARLTLPPGVTDSSLVSVDLDKSARLLFDMIQQNDPDSAAKFTHFAEVFRNRTGLSIQDDLLAKVGPRMSVISPGGGGLGNMLGMWFSPPEIALVAELKDPRTFATTLDKLMEVANRELKTAGAMVPPQPGEPSKPGTSFAEFRKLREPERGYVLAVPPAVLPTPAGLRPTMIIDPGKKLIAFGTSPAATRKALGSLDLNGAAMNPPRDPGAIAVSQGDPSQSLPSVLVNLPSIVQFLGFAATQPNAGRPRPPGPPLRLEIDPDAIPTADSLRPYLFPTKFTITSNPQAIRFTTFQAFPIHVPEINSGMEAPVLVALLLPATQAAREAARRAQCVNNLKQMGLAMHNYHQINGGFPASAITDKNGKPLLSWRVAILPLMEQQELYNKFKLDEPWDSPNNKPLIAEMPNVFACPSNPPQPGSGLTTYKVFTGEGTLLDPVNPTGIAQVTDGTSNTIMVVESGEGVPWTKPDDLPFPAPGKAGDKLLGAKSNHSGGFNALMADGSVRFIKSTINAIVWRALITRAGGEVVSSDSF